MVILPRTDYLCLSCRSQLLRSLLNHKFKLPWLSLRSMAQLRKKPPARMVLSPKVAETSPTSSKSKDKKRQPSPFGSLNVTEARIKEPTKRQRPSSKASNLGSKAQKGSKSRGKSKDNIKALKMQRALTGVPYTQRSTIKSEISNVESFENLPLLPVLQQAIPNDILNGLIDISPTPIQRLAIPVLLDGAKGVGEINERTGVKVGYRRFLLAAETGSGKTLAYVIPLIDAVKRAEIKRKEAKESELQKESMWEKEKRELNVVPSPPPTAPHHTAGRPRGLILVPTAELANQVGAVVKKFSHTVKFKASVISADFSVNVIRSRLFGSKGIDILISTPHLLSSIAEKDPNILSKISHFVVDEADSLFDRSFAPITSKILDRARPSLKQLILCSATIPRSLDGYLRRRFPDITRLVTPNLHAVPRRVQLGVVDAVKDPYRGNKDLACADTIWTIGSNTSEKITDENTEGERIEQKLVMVFVNEREKSQELADFLVSKGIDAVALNRDASDRKSSQTLSTLTSREKSFVSVSAEGTVDDGTSEPNKKPRRTLKNTKVLVATDLGSRGIDTLALRNVILYDVPFSTVDFIHRLGRVGRMGRRGRAYVIVDRHDRRDVVREVQDSMYKGQALI